ADLAGAVAQDEDVVWPVYAGRAVSGPLHAWTRVADRLPPKYVNWTDEGLGRCQNEQYMTCSPSPLKQRLLWMFTGLGEIGALNSSDIISATFSVYGTHAYNCTPRPVTLYRVGDFDASTTWPGGGLWDYLDQQTITHRAACST